MSTLYVAAAAAIASVYSTDSPYRPLIRKLHLLVSLLVVKRVSVIDLRGEKAEGKLNELVVEVLVKRFNIVKAEKTNI